MKYQGQRNFGCRFLEIELNGYRTLIVENEKIRVMFLADKGMDVIEFNYKPLDIDFAWRSPNGLRHLHNREYSFQDDQFLTDYYTGGWFHCFPNVGEACVYKGAKMPIYGESCYLPWDYSILTDTPELLEIKAKTYMVKTPFLMEKTITLRSGEASIRFDMTITNLGGEKLHYQWGYHPNISPNFLSPEVLINIPRCKTINRFAGKNSDILQECVGIWPEVTGRDGNLVDLSRFNLNETKANDFTLLENPEKSVISIINSEKKIEFNMSWDKNAWEHASVWRVNNSDFGYPRYGKTRVLGFVISNDLTWGLNNIDENSHVLDSMESKEGWLEFGVKKTT